MVPPRTGHPGWKRLQALVNRFSSAEFGVPSRLVRARTEIPTLHPRGLRLPPQLEGLSRLAFNLYWSWHPEVRSLFARIDRATYQRHRDPVPVLQTPRD